MFRTRIWTLAGSIIFYSNGIKPINYKFSVYQLVKCFFSCIDCLCLIDNNYVSTYKEKLKIYNAKYANHFPETIVKLCNDVKLKSNFDPHVNFESLYKNISDKFLEIFNLGLNLYYGVNNSLDKKVTKYYGVSLVALITKYLQLYFTNNTNNIELVEAQYYIVLKAKNYKYNSKRLNYLMKKYKAKDIEDFRSLITNLRLC